MPVETRYMRSDQHTVNGVTAYVLGTSQTTTYVSVGISWAEGNYIFIRVYKVSQSGAKTWIADGASISAPDTGLLSATISIPQTSLDPTDAIEVDVIEYDVVYGELIRASFITEVLNAQSLNASTWTVYYYIYYSAGLYYFLFGTTTYNSRIENFNWTPYVPPPVAKRIIGDGFVWIVC